MDNTTKLVGCHKQGLAHSNRSHTTVSSRSPKQRSNDKLTLKVERKKTIHSYVNCLRLFHHTHFSGKFGFSSEAQYHHFVRVMAPYSFSELPKVFKGLLADTFSIMLDQDRPDVPLEGNHLFYPSYRRHIHLASTSSKIDRVKYFWDLMQTKAVAAPVTEQFVKEALIKHSRTVSKVTRTEPEILDEFAEFCRPVMEDALEYLKTQSFSLPNCHSSYETPRSKGGVSAHWPVEDSELIQPIYPRLDPVTVLVTGPPGCGKSLLQTKVAKLLSKRLGSTYPDTMYSRNANTEHWDGYKNQPLVLVDDFLQINLGNTTNTQATEKELIALNSTVDYVCPMAKLEEKGRLFNSPLIVYSSNMSFENMMQLFTKINTSDRALFRRFDYVVEYHKGNWVIKTPFEITGYRTINFQHIFQTRNPAEIARKLESELVSSWTHRCHTYSQIYEEVYTVPLKGTSVQALRVPRELTPHNRVKVSPVVEPLKIRTITIGTARNFILKPLQECLLKALQKYPEFKPCFTPKYDEELYQLASNAEVYLSGDYSSATDGLHSDLFRSGFRFLAEGLPPWMKDDFEREIQPHLCEYPKKYGIPDTYQTNGQLMGSLLSFPLLCLANAFTLCKATGKSLGSIPALLHGDDVAAFISQKEINTWKEFCPKVGLGLSVGKNYVDEDFVSIDSQVFMPKFRTKLGTGKYRCYQTHAEQAITRLLEKGLPKPLVVSLMNKNGLLKNTPRSIDVSTKFGGLGVEGEPFDLRSKAIWWDKVQKHIGSVKLSNVFQYTLPTERLKEFDLKLTPKCEDRPIVDNRKLFRLIEKFEKLDEVPEFPHMDLPSVGTVFRKNRDPILENMIQSTLDDLTHCEGRSAFWL